MGDLDFVASQFIREYECQTARTDIAMKRAQESEVRRYEIEDVTFDPTPPTHFLVINHRHEYLYGFLRARPIFGPDIDSALVINPSHPDLSRATNLPSVTTLPAPWYMIRSGL